VSISTKVVSSNPVHGDVFSIQHYVIMFVSDLRQVGGFSPGIPVSSTNKITHLWGMSRSLHERKPTDVPNEQHRDRSYHWLSVAREITWIIPVWLVEIKIIVHWPTHSQHTTRLPIRIIHPNIVLVMTIADIKNK
jgi:hypothetical protein